MEVCNVCAHKARHSKITWLPKWLFGSSASIVKCCECGVARTVPMPAVNEDYYVASTHYEGQFEVEKSRYCEFANELIDFIESELQRRRIKNKSQSLLDVGAGRGWLVKQADSRGFKAYGIELNKVNVKRAKLDGISLYESMDSLKTDLGIEKFDIISFSAVLEHVSDPISFLQFYTKHLKPGGLIVLAQAAYDGFLPKIAPWLWYGWQPQEHYWHFDRNGLIKILSYAGVSEIFIRRVSLYHGFCLTKNFKITIGKNLGSAIGRFGALLGLGDQLFASATLAEKSNHP